MIWLTIGYYSLLKKDLIVSAAEGTADISYLIWDMST